MSEPIFDMPSLESVSDQVGKMLESMSELGLKSSISFDDVAAVESFCPNGKTIGMYFSNAPKATKYRVALEEMSRGIIAMIAGAIVAIVAIIFKIYKFFTTGTSSGSGGSGGSSGPTLANTDDEGRIVKPEEAINHTVEVVEPQAREFVELGEHASADASEPTQDDVQSAVRARIEALGEHIESRSKTSRKWTNCISREQINNTVIGRIITKSDVFFSGMFKPGADSGKAFVDNLGPTTEYVKFCTKMLRSMAANVKSGKDIHEQADEIQKSTLEIFRLARFKTLQEAAIFATQTYTNAVQEADNLRGTCARKGHVVKFILKGRGGVLSAPGRFISEFNIHNIGSAFYDLKKYIEPLQQAAKALDEYHKAFTDFTETGIDQDQETISLQEMLKGADLKDMMSAIQITQSNLRSYVFAYNVYIQEVSAFLNTYREICKIALMHPDAFVKNTERDAADKKIKDIRDRVAEVNKAITAFVELPEIKLR